MGGVRKIVILIALFTTVNVFATIDSHNFVGYFNNYSRLPIHLASKLVRTDFEYVFIAGFLSEAVRGEYFEDNVKALKRFGVSDEHIHIVRPRTRGSIWKNLPELSRDLNRIFELRKKQLVIIAHSKGAAEVLALALVDTPWAQRVHKMFLVQAAIGGSGIADYLKGEGARIDKRMPLLKRLAFRAVREAKPLIKPILSDGLKSLTHSESRKLWPSLMEPSAVEAVTDKIYYVRSAQAQEDMSELIVLAGSYLDTYYGKNDGLVTLEDQYLPGVGHRLGIINADHLDLTISKPLSRSEDKLRYALMYAIVQTVMD